MMKQTIIELMPWILRLLIGGLVGASIGWQRQIHGSPAGLRTHILVCLGATLLTSLDMLHSAFQGKIAAAVVTGIGFLGAGTIIHTEKGDTVRGLTTAASVWVTAGIGIALGSGGPSTYLGVFAAILVLATLSVVFHIEDFALRHRRNRNLTLVVNRPSGVNSDDIISRLVTSLSASGAAVETMKKDAPRPDSNEVVVHFQLRLPDAYPPSDIVRICGADPNITQVSWDL